ncbi:MAG: GxGYxYP domain-containing protein, partial [Chloroflexota bacterium]
MMHIKTLRCFFTLFITVVLSACTLTPTPAQAIYPPQQLYLFDVSTLHLNHYEHCIALMGEPGVCDETAAPPPGKSYEQLLHDYDTLIFLTTLQGIVNRGAPRLYLNHDHQRLETPGVDAFWLEQYQMADQPYGWLAETDVIELADLEELLTIFADDVEGLVVWDPAVPATLNVATTIAGIEDLAVLRADSDITTQVTAHLAVEESLVGLFQ